MKKLALVTLLAVAASWLLSEARQPSDPVFAHRQVVMVNDNGKVLEPPKPPKPPKPPRSKRGASKLVAAQDPAAPPSLMAPAAPVAPPAPALPGKPPMPAWFPRSDAEEATASRPDSAGARVLIGRVSASEDRARQDLRQLMEREVGKWIAADVPTSWKVPAPVIDGLLQGSYVQGVTRALLGEHKPVDEALLALLGDTKPAGSPSAGELASKPSEDEVAGIDRLYTLYRAGQKVDFSARQKARIIEIYRRELASQRLQRLGGGLALALVGLAVLSGYIKADEATKGYYTNRLRLVAAAGLGVAGVAAYRYLS